jgi:hypothetical protein
MAPSAMVVNRVTEAINVAIRPGAFISNGCVYDWTCCPQLYLDFSFWASSLVE